MKYSVLARTVLVFGAFWLGSPADAQEFRRGDVDGDGRVTIADAVRITWGLFSIGISVFPCLDAADVNADGSVDSGDDLILLSWLFIPGAQAPAAPGPFACGPDPFPDSLDCGDYTSCVSPLPIPPVDDQLTLSVGTATADAGELVEIRVTLDNLGSSDIAGWSYATCHDPAIVNPVGVERGAAYLNWAHLGADFFQSTLTADGVVFGVVMSVGAQASLPPGEDLELAIVTYECLAGGESALAICGGLGDPTIDVVFVSTALESRRPLTVDGSIDVAPLFIRGDCNDDGIMDVADAVFALAALFVAGSTQPACLEACDVQDAGYFDIPGAIVTLTYLFLAGSPGPPAPFPECGPDPTTTIGCDRYQSCP